MYIFGSLSTYHDYELASRRARARLITTHRYNQNTLGSNDKNEDDATDPLRSHYVHCKWHIMQITRYVSKTTFLLYHSQMSQDDKAHIG